MSKTALAAVAALFLASAGVAAAATMDCCKDCAKPDCCDEMKADQKAPADQPTPTPAPAPKG
ncbi:ammonium transporter family protein [Caulobacter sp. 17J80-11]|uniref:ammonium transporter family protein n=1 Tax=Caulobacter sp. 17J80-11 TaxID=2763502 RepID=UPI0016534AF1|nr:ammonium transporter family protein [Caulobacter sp. 17J80-11]MBC6980915.1 ammonium transporter family protein [Caulobacter sp. 17J80-11]